MTQNTAHVSQAQLWRIAIQTIDEQLTLAPSNLSLQFERACLLAESGRFSEAQTAYLKILIEDPTHLGALNNLGSLLYQTGYRTAAHTAYTEAVARYPADPMSRVNMANALLDNEDYAAAKNHYQEALRIDPAYAPAHQGLSYALRELGDEEGAALHRQQGFAASPIVTMPYYGEQPPVPVLLLISALRGNTPTQWLFDKRVYQLYTVFAEYVESQTDLPPHLLVFNAISDADLCMTALHKAKALLTRTHAPVLNAPAGVEQTARDAMAARLSPIPGLIVPRTRRLTRAQLTGQNAERNLAELGMAFPLLLRAPGYHTGRFFVKVEQPSDLAASCAQLPGDEWYAIEYLDARGRDGLVRKYRVMLIDGTLYPLHLAISSDWKVHYFRSEMAASSKHRTEEEAFLLDMQRVLGTKAMTALASVQKEVGLDYAGIDFGLNQDGEVLLFEVNATMIVHPPEPDPTWDYRRPATARVIAAFRRMIDDTVKNRANRSSEITATTFTV